MFQLEERTAEGPKFCRLVAHGAHGVEQFGVVVVQTALFTVDAVRVRRPATRAATGNESLEAPRSAWRAVMCDGIPHYDHAELTQRRPCSPGHLLDRRHVLMSKHHVVPDIGCGERLLDLGGELARDGKDVTALPASGQQHVRLLPGGAEQDSGVFTSGDGSTP